METESTVTAENRELVKHTHYKTVKKKFVQMLQNKTFCCVCFESGCTLHNLSKIVTLEHWEKSYSESLKEVLHAVLGDKVVLQSEYLCEHCNDAVLKSYMFILDTKSTARIIDSLSDQLHEHIMQFNTFGSSKDNLNTIIVLRDPIIGESILQPVVKAEEDDELSKKDTKVYCGHCYTSFNAKKHLKRHIKAYHTDLPSTDVPYNDKSGTKLPTYCTECKTDACVHKDYLISYSKQKALGSEMIKCINCPYKCNLKASLIVHANKYHLKMLKYMCDICSKQFHTKVDLRNHVMAYHSTLFPCEYCDRTFRTEAFKEKHKDICKNVQREFKCSECLCSFDVRRSLIHHKRRKHSQEFKCDICNKVLISESNLAQHKLFHMTEHEVERRNYYCPYCNKPFFSMVERNAHVSRSHPSEQSPKCTLCNLTFKSMILYYRHNASIKHLRKINPNVKQKHKCKQCDYSTYSLLTLEQHVNRYHLKILPYCCEICLKKFAGQSKLKEHMKTHNKTKKDFQCETCKKYFCGPKALKDHVRIHTGECPYTCDLCDMKFKTNTLKNSHRLKHAEKTVECPLCGSKFYSAPNMRSHVKKVHWKRKEPFDATKLKGLSKEDLDLFRDKRMISVEKQ